MKVDAEQRYGSWSGARISAFLEASRIPLRLSFNTVNGLLVVPLWFMYESDRIWSCSPLDSLLVKSLKSNPAAAFDVSTNSIPYKGVRGRCRADCSPAADKGALEQLLNKYLAGTDNALAQWLLSRDDTEAVIELDITWLTSWDFSERMRDLA